MGCRRGYAPEAFHRASGGRSTPAPRSALAHTKRRRTDEDQDTCYAFDSEVSYVPGANADWFDVEIITSGSRAGRDGKAEDFSVAKRFVFDGTEYRISISGRGEKGVAR